MATVAVDEPGAPLAFGSAEEWRVLVTLAGRPLARLALSDPGVGAGEATFDASVLAACDDERRRALLAERLKQRLGVRPRTPLHRPVSVVVCTRARLDTLEVLLEALGRLDPRPDEVVVVDNAPPPGQDCRELVARAGADYVREDRPGLNNARAAGVAAARGELLAFTDDDCVPPPGWLAALDEVFDDANVGAATGPAFPLVLDTPSRRRFEEVASFSRGMVRRDFDWTFMSPVEATRAGAGANMVMRRALVERLGEVFPPELDVGTATRSGGDMYALFRVLAAGARVAYEPRLFTYHLHRSNPAAVHHTVRGYGVGLSAVATKLLVEEGETGAFKVWGWLVRQYAHAVGFGLTGRLDRTAVRIAWDYLRGGFSGPAALREARRQRPQPRAAAEPAPRVQPAPARPRPDGPPQLSAIVITHRDPSVARQCLAALGAQAGPPFEIVLVDDSPDGAAAGIEPPPGVPLRRVITGGRGAAAARNTGAQAASAGLLLFLDDDLVPAPDLVARHVERHRDAGPGAVVIGYSPPRPVRANLISQSAAMWWEDHFKAKREQVAPTFVDMLSGNMSVARELFERVGPFDEGFGRFRREDWEWGIRVLGAGARIVYDHGAVAQHRFDLDPRGRVAAARAEGHGDALLLRRHPTAQAPLGVTVHAPPRDLLGRLVWPVVVDERGRDCVLALLTLLERVKARTTWARWFDVTQRGAYEQGLREGGGREHADLGAVPVVRIELESDDPVPLPQVVPPVVEVDVYGVGALGLVPPEGQWTARLAEVIAMSIPGRHLGRVRRLRRTHPEPQPLDRVTVVLGPDDDLEAAERLRESGADVRVLDGGPWDRLDHAVRDGGRQFLAFPLGGAVPSVRWLEECVEACEGARVAAVTGAALEDGHEGHPVLLAGPQDTRPPYPVIGPPSRYLIVRRDAYLQLGALNGRLGRLNDQVQVLDFLERARRAGWVVGYRNTAGLGPPNGDGWDTRGAEWRRFEARGALVARDARTRGLPWLLRFGAAPIVVRVVRAARLWRGGWVHSLGTAAAFTVGLVRGFVDG